MSEFDTGGCVETDREKGAPPPACQPPPSDPKTYRGAGGNPKEAAALQAGLYDDNTKFNPNHPDRVADVQKTALKDIEGATRRVKSEADKKYPNDRTEAEQKADAQKVADAQLGRGNLKVVHETKQADGTYKEDGEQKKTGEELDESEKKIRKDLVENMQTKQGRERIDGLRDGNGGKHVTKLADTGDKNGGSAGPSDENSTASPAGRSQTIRYSAGDPSPGLPNCTPGRAGARPSPHLDRVYPMPSDGVLHHEMGHAQRGVEGKENGAPATVGPRADVEVAKRNPRVTQEETEVAAADGTYARERREVYKSGKGSAKDEKRGDRDRYTDPDRCRVTNDGTVLPASPPAP